MIKGRLSGKKQEKKKEKKKTKKIHLADLLAQCGQQRVFVVMDIEGKELDVLKTALIHGEVASSFILINN